MEDKEVKLQSYVIKYSIILALIGIAISTLVYIIDETLMVKWWLGIIMLLVNFGLLVYFGIIIRNENGGYMSFKKAFIAIFLIAFFATIISSGYNLVLHNVIDPELKVRLTEAMTEQSRQMMERFGAPEDQIDEAIDKLEEQDSFGNAALLKSSALAAIIGGLIYGLICGAIVKKKIPESDIM